MTEIQKQDKPISIVALAPYRIYPATTGGQRCASFFYGYLSKIAPVALVSVKHNAAPAGFEGKFLPVMMNATFRYANVFFFFRLRRIVKQEQATHLILDHPYFGWLGFLVQKFCTVKLVIHSHNIEGERFKTMRKWWWKMLLGYEKWVHCCADHSFFITPEDEAYALRNFKLNPAKTSVATYGTTIRRMPSQLDRQQAKQAITSQYQIKQEELILLFAGAMQYGPNATAAEAILTKLAPVLAARRIPHKIIFCGGDANANITTLVNNNANVIYAGFVEDIDLYYKAADVFLNTVNEGGGIKTKLVEAIANGTSAVSTIKGALGVPPALCDGKLALAELEQAHDFVTAIENLKKGNATPTAFYAHFYWGTIADTALQQLHNML